MAKTNTKSKKSVTRKAAPKQATKSTTKSRSAAAARPTVVVAKPRKRFVRKRQVPGELDGVYLLKLVMILVVGSMWVRFVGDGQRYQIPVPVGLLIGLAFVMREKYKVDRKIDYALLLLAMFVGFWTQVGIYITI
jgi:hypothetical protein